jgi:hypothetical protein
MTQSNIRFQLGQAPKDSFLGGVMQRQTFNSDHRLLGSIASRFGAILAMTGLLLLSACDGSGDTVTDNNLPEFGKDGVPPVLESVTVQPNGIVEPGDLIKITIVASEALMTPVAYINGVEVEVTGGILNWSVAREITESEPPGNVTFSIVFQDISGELGQAVSSTTDGSAALTGSLISLALVRPKGTRPGGVLPTQVLTGRVPAGLTIFMRSVATAPSRMFRATKRGLKPGKALSRMVVTPRLHLTMAATMLYLSTTKRPAP